MNRKRISNSGLKKLSDFFFDPTVLKEEIQRSYPTEKNFVVAGDLLNRCILFQHSEDTFILFPIYQSGIPSGFLKSFAGYIVGQRKVKDHYQLTVDRPVEFLNLLERPHVKLISLFHKENFPLPRFPLGISDIAGAIRSNFLGRVSLSDMQFDKSTGDILKEIKLERPDIIGLSATFGQQDLVNELLTSISLIKGYKPQIILGGSLSTLNAAVILECFPEVLISKGYGETTMKDLVACWHKQIPKESINYISFNHCGEIITTFQKKDDKTTYILPELDLLEDTLAFNGVMQLEASRGCTYHCSFCPRGHKGSWSGETSKDLQQILPFVRLVFDRYPKIVPKIFLVDEEFIGYQSQDSTTYERALAIGDLLLSYGFRFESSTRIDQVFRPLKENQDKNRQVERIDFWKKLIHNGLDRMLFGVESGVDTILKRYNKQATSHQNTIAIRILTTIGVPLRLTYITFDPLMTMEELILSYHFQGRTDMILKPNSSLSAEEILGAVFDEQYIAANSKEVPLFTEISYMLVSMESLVGSKYLSMVEEEGLAEEHVFSMGKRNARFKDPDIGLMSSVSQKWVDRNFALDYLLKSIMKFSDPTIRQLVFQLRGTLKKYAYSLLGKMLSLANNNPSFLYQPNIEERSQINYLLCRWDKDNLALKNQLLTEIVNQHFDALVEEFSLEFAGLKGMISAKEYEMIAKQALAWKKKNKWHIINSR